MSKTMPATSAAPTCTRTCTGPASTAPMIPTKGQSTLFGDTRRQDLVSLERPSRRRSSIQRVADLAGCVSVALRLDEELESSSDDSFSSSSSVHNTDAKNFMTMAIANNNGNGTDQGRHQCDSVHKQAVSGGVERSHRPGTSASASASAPPPNQRRRRASVDCCASTDSLHDAILQSLMDETKTANTSRSKTGQQRRRIKLIGSSEPLNHSRLKPRSSSCHGAISNTLAAYHDSRDSLHAMMMESIRMRGEDGEDSPVSPDCKKLVDAPHFGSSQFTVCDGLVVLKSSSRRRSFSATGA